MSQGKIDKLIINSPYEEPRYYWSYHRETKTFSKKEGRRPAGYVVATLDSQSYDDPGIFVEIPLVNQIRPRVKAWRENDYPGATGVTKRLLAHWYDPEERTLRRFFFCQLEAIETLMWLVEAPPADKVGVEILSDGGGFARYCSKLATGTGKTVVMAMLIAWNIANKTTYPQDKRFSKHILVVAPGLTVKSRLQVIDPASSDNYYEEFNIVPTAFLEKLRLGKVLIRNWHALNWETDEKIAKKKSVDKRGAKSDEAYVREVLGDMASVRNVLVINDEAHHAWRVPAGPKVRGVKKQEIDEATKWIGGLDRIHKVRGILRSHDFSATPFIPSGKRAYEEALFDWIISDFGLNDSIESGLVKTPRVVIRDDTVPDAKTYKSRLYHIYNDQEVKDDLNRKAEPHEPLPDLVGNAYYLLGVDWRDTLRSWEQEGFKTPPVMITVANRTETAARIKYAFDRERIDIEELCEPGRILHIDSRVLEMAESQESVDYAEGLFDRDEEDQAPKLTKKQQAELLRRQVDTVGQTGKDGELINNVISVGMLSEGWDAKTVSHIMGLRAFTSQLLCEQVVGRGLRRTAYETNDDGLFEAEYVNIFGVPFTFLPHEGGEGPPPKPTPPKTKIEPDDDKKEFEISFPNIIRIEHVFKPLLTLEPGDVDLIELYAAQTATIADLAPVVEGKPDVTKISKIDMENLAKENRTQRIIFRTASEIYDQMQPQWKGNKEFLLAQLIGIVERFIKADRIVIDPPLFNQDELRRRLMITLNMTRIIQHLWDAIRVENAEQMVPVFDRDWPIKSTADMRPWYTGKPCEYSERSHINFCVFDSTWEATEAFTLDHDPNVSAWVKNDHLGFEILYIYRGVVRKYRPDFIIRLVNGEYLVLEVKGQDKEQDKTKRAFLKEWTEAVNRQGGFGTWRYSVSYSPSDVTQKIHEAVHSADL
jgi:type III restriction enzyme